jgi:hypothetical protein
MTKYVIDDLELVGSFSVDSGQAMVGDPCYLDSWQNNKDEPFELDGKVGDYSYLGACATTISSGAGELGISSAIVFSTGYGDGHYPVYVKYNEDGRIVKVVIDFEDDLDEDNE